MKTVEALTFRRKKVKREIEIVIDGKKLETEEKAERLLRKRTSRKKQESLGKEVTFAVFVRKRRKFTWI